MSAIRIIYHGQEPNFPATDQHHDAERFYVCDGEVHSAAQWTARLAAAQAGARQAVYGISDAAAIERQLEAQPERRGELKQRLAQEHAKHAPALAYVVDAIGSPTIEEIDAVLKAAAQKPDA